MPLQTLIGINWQIIKVLFQPTWPPAVGIAPNSPQMMQGGSKLMPLDTILPAGSGQLPNSSQVGLDFLGVWSRLTILTAW
jgi:hypothetical protein